jgi:D-alanyl-D-alanine carboxypeptidase
LLLLGSGGVAAQNAAELVHPAPAPVACVAEHAAPPRFTREQLAAAVEPIAERAIREQKVVGLSVGIAHRGEPLYLAGFGMADLERQRPATEDTRYDVGSINKMFTAILLLQFAERGLLDLDDPVSRHIPDYDGPMRDATIRQLLNHTSGFHGPNIDETREQPELERPQSVTELLAMPTVSEARRSDPPGTVFRYSNSAFHLLGTVVQVIAEQGYGEVALEQVFRPAGMTSSVAAEWPTGPDAAGTYMWRAGQLVRPPPIHPSALGGAVITSVRDLLSFQCALNAGMLISRTSLALVREPTLVRMGDDAVRVPYGLGTMMGPFETRQMVGHQGTWPGGSAQLANYPDDDLTIAILTNTNLEGTVQARELGSWMAHAIFQDTAPGFFSSPLPIDEEFARIATGRFRWSGFVNETTWEEGELRVRDPATGELVGRLLRVGPLATTFVRANEESTGELPAHPDPWWLCVPTWTPCPSPSW